MTSELVGKSHTFDDGSVIEVLQVKDREIDCSNVPCVTYTIMQGRSLPRKLVLSEIEFIQTYGHLFGFENEHTQGKNN